MTKDNFEFQLVFKGSLVENSVDAFDVANTILATSHALQEISSIRYGDDAPKNFKLHINAFKEGSLITDFLYLLDQGTKIAVPLIPIASNIYEVGTNILNVYRTYIDIKKALRGKQPKEVKAINDSSIQITTGDNAVFNINYFDFRALQSQTLGKNVTKAMQPLAKEDSLVEQIDILVNKEPLVSVGKQDSPYFELTDNLQLLDSVKYKGIITKIDTRARSGFINVGSKRLAFNYSRDIDLQKFSILVDSLKKQIKIILIGKASMDFEGNPRHLEVNDVQSEMKLF